MTIVLAELVRRFDSESILLPLMQRDYIWKASKRLDLLDSIYRGWPIGAFYVWQTSEDYPDKNKFGSYASKHPDNFFGFLLDGQQRLTSLVPAIRSASNGELDHRAFFDVHNERFFLGKSNITVSKRVENYDPFLIPLSDIVLCDDSKVHSIETLIARIKDSAKITKKEETDYRKLLDRLSTLYDCAALCEVFPEKTEHDAFVIFSRLNKGGTKLTTGDVEGARLASEKAKGIVGPMRKMASEPSVMALGLNFVFLLRCLVTVYRGNSSFSKLPKNWANDVASVNLTWKATEKAVRRTIEFIKKRIRLDESVVVAINNGADSGRVSVFAT